MGYATNGSCWRAVEIANFLGESVKCSDLADPDPMARPAMREDCRPNEAAAKRQERQVSFRAFWRELPLPRKRGDPAGVARRGINTFGLLALPPMLRYKMARMGRRWMAEPLTK